MGVAADANARYGRNRRPSVLDVKANDEGEEEGNGSDGDGGGNSTDDDLRAVSGLPRKHSARAPPPKLTSTQERVISALREAHGPNNVEAMVKDIKSLGYKTIGLRSDNGPAIFKLLADALTKFRVTLLEPEHVFEEHTNKQLRLARLWPPLSTPRESSGRTSWTCSGGSA